MIVCKTIVGPSSCVHLINRTIHLRQVKSFVLVLVLVKYVQRVRHIPTGSVP